MKNVVSCRNLSFSYGSAKVFEDFSFQIPAGSITGIIGPDGAGKSTLLSLISGTRGLQQGTLEVLETDFRNSRRRTAVMERMAYMPQGLGKNLYFSLTVEENLTFFASLYSGDKEGNQRRIALLTEATGLEKFLKRPAGKLSGGMKQKLGLCCALIHTPDLLILDEPTTGVDPLARRQFRELLRNVKRARPQMSIIVSTAYMDEAANSDFVVVMDHGKLLAQGTPAELLRQTESENLESAFISLLPEERRAGHKKIKVIPQTESSNIIIDAQQLTREFGTFTAVDKVSFRICEGEIFGFLGSNGCGKTTTMRMLTGLLPPTSGSATLFGTPVTGRNVESRKILGYMTQNFSLYNELSVRQNLQLYARLYGIPEERVTQRVRECIEKFQLEDAALFPSSLPPGVRQKLSLAAAVLHAPKLLILDEPTSGVDPVTRDKFWELILELSRKDKVTIFISTHFMNEAQRCDRISLMHAGKSLVCDTPERIVKMRHCSDLESAFISFLEEYSPAAPDKKAVHEALLSFGDVSSGKVSGLEKYFSFRRFFSCFRKEFEELVRDPVRITLALFGTLILMAVMGFGISMDVENLTFAVLDHDNSESSRNYILNLAGSRYFKERPPLKSYDEMERRMKSGELSMVIEIPPRFGKDLARKAAPEIGVWVDGSMPMRAETINGYIRAMHAKWLAEKVPAGTGSSAEPHADVEVRYRYNPDVRSLPAMVPGVIPVLLMMLPAALTALAVVREKENGSIINLYATPLTRAEFMLGKQLPYIIFASLSALFMVAAAETLFDVHVKGNIFLLLAALFFYAAASTGFGLLSSAVTRSQIAALFLTMMCTMLPAVQLCGLVTPVETQGALPRFIGSIYPTTYMLLISRGIFNKNLDFQELSSAFFYFAVAVPLIVACAVFLQKKQEK